MYVKNSVHTEKITKKFMDVKERFRKYADFKGISHRKFSLELGKSDKFIDTKGGVNSDVFEIVRKKFPDLNIIWLLFGEGNMTAIGHDFVNEPRSNYGLEQEIEHLKELLKAKEETIAILKQTTGFKEKPSKAS